MEPVIVLRSEAEDAQRPPIVLFCLPCVCLPEQTCNGEFPTFDPDPRGFINTPECHQSTVCTGNDPVWIVGILNRSSLRFEFTKEFQRENMNVGCDNNAN